MPQAPTCEISGWHRRISIRDWRPATRQFTQTIFQAIAAEIRTIDTARDTDLLLTNHNARPRQMSCQWIGLCDSSARSQTSVTRTEIEAWGRNVHTSHA